MFTVEGNFKEYQYNGIKSYRNPQIEIVISSDTEVVMTFTPKIKRKQNLWIRIVRPQDHEERTKLSPDDEVLFRSAKTAAKSVSLTANMTPGRYLAIISTRKKNQKYHFTFSVNKSPGIESVRLCDDYERHTISGTWKVLHEGYSNVPRNPQFLLHTKGNGKFKAYVYVRDESKKNKLFLVVTKPPNPIARKTAFSESEYIACTQNKAHTWVSTFADLDASEGPYLVTVCSSRILPFTLTVETESSGRGKIDRFEELPISEEEKEEIEGEDDADDEEEDKILFHEHPENDKDYLKIYCISDTHGDPFADRINSWVENSKQKEYDLFMFCGDATARGHTADTKIQVKNLKKSKYLLSEQSVSMNFFCGRN